MDSSSDSTMDPEKGSLAAEAAANADRRRESVESDGPHVHDDEDAAQTSIARKKTSNSNYLTPLHSTRSRSSVRSQKSYAGADGYTHFAHEDERPEPPAADGAADSKNANGNDGDASEKDFEVRWTGPEDPQNPKSAGWAPLWRKWTIVLLGSASSMCVTFASALYTSAYGGIEREFAISRLAATVGLSIFVCGLGLGPMFLSPLSEFYGRRPIYLCAFGMYFVWLIPCARAENLATMLVARFLDGLSGSAFLSVAGLLGCPWSDWMPC